MGAQGGYAYLDRNFLLRVYGSQDTDTFIRFVERMFYWPQREGAHLYEIEAERFGDRPMIRLPVGSNVGPEETLLPIEKLPLGAYLNPDDLVFYKAHLWDLHQEMESKGVEEIEPIDERRWWRNPLSWYVWLGIPRKYLLPNSDEFKALVRVARALNEYEYVETWT